MASLTTSINGTLTMVIKTANGFPFTVCVSPDMVSRITTRQVAELLTREITLFSRTVIGRIARTVYDPGPEEGFWPQIKDEYLNQHLTATKEQFWRLIDNYGKWDSFAEFLRADIGYDIDASEVSEQVPLEYYCLVGRRNSSKTLHPYAKYKKQSLGVFVDPAAKTIPIYTSSLMADISAQNYREQYGVNLLPNSILCLGCFLYSFVKENGCKVVENGLLNDQWQVSFFNCHKEKSKTSQRYFKLQDKTGEQYTLVGCPDTSNPVWF
jgi:hypothetical protein